jgi:plastocyanin
MDRRSFLATGAAVAATALSGCGVAGESRTNTDYDVGMSTARFKPGEVTVPVGDTLVWKNTSSHAHTVTAYEAKLPDDADFFASGEFDSQKAAQEEWRSGSGGAIYSGESYEHTFEMPGEYPYFCIPHEANGMVGTVRVVESTATASTETE